MIAWIREHPAIFYLLVTGLATVLFKPQTDARYAALAIRHPRIAEWWRVVGALGIDPLKAAMIIAGMFKEPPPIRVNVSTYPPPLTDDDPTNPGTE